MATQKESKGALQWALKYHALDFPVFPAKHRSKSPAIEWKCYQTKRPTKEEVTSWFSNDNDSYNVAVVLGKISRGLEIDIDGYGGKQRFDEITFQLNNVLQSKIRSTMHVISANGSKLLFRFRSEEWPNGICTKRLWKGEEEHDGIELRANGTYSIGLGSVHPNGVPYTLFDEKKGVPLELSKSELQELASKIGTNANEIIHQSVNDNIILDDYAVTAAALEPLHKKMIEAIAENARRYYVDGSKNDFTVAFCGCLRKKGITYDDAFRIIYLIDPTDKTNHERVKYIYKHRGGLAGISNLKHVLKRQGLSDTEVISAVTALFAPIDALNSNKNNGHSLENIIDTPKTGSLISIPIRNSSGIGNICSVTRLELHSDSLKQVTDKTKMLEETGQKIIINRSVVEVTSRPIILKRIIKVEDTELLEVSYGEDKFYGNVKEIEEYIRRTGGIVSTELFKSSLSTIIEHQRDNANRETAYPCLGVFVDSVSKRFVVAHPKLINNVLNLKRHYLFAIQFILRFFFIFN
jgi:hypothetical protein